MTERFPAPLERPKRLSQLAKGLGKPSGDADIVRIVDDSRAVQPGDAYLCLPRAEAFAQEYADEACAKGAAAVISVGHTLGTTVPYLRLDDMETAGRLLRRFFDTENCKTRLVGITGTDGKTSVAWMLREALERKGRKAWSVGTLGWMRAPSDVTPLENTTPSLLTMHAILAEACRAGVHDLVIEASSHGIAQERIAGLDFHAVIWTSIGHDHLQDHGGYQAYVQTKRGFVHAQAGRGAVAVLNADHPDIVADMPKRARTYGHGLYRASLTLGWEQELPGMVRLRKGDEEVRIEDIPLGEFHAENVACVGLTLNAGWRTPLGKLPELLGGLSAPPGRLEDLAAGRYQVFIDYAHTPEALARCLKAARLVTRRRLLLVFGCGGDRDHQKRPRMGEIAATHADVVWITSDNPRSEPPEVIASEIEHGMPKPYPAEVHLQLDRERAIAEAVAMLEPGDTLVIAGKGHEPYMEIGGRRIPWSDAEVARRCLAEKQRRELARCA